MQRYEPETPVSPIHIDIKKLACFPRFGHCIIGSRQQGHSTGVGYVRVHVAIDDATRQEYDDVLADEQQSTVIGFLSRAATWFNAQWMEYRHVKNDNGSAYISQAFAKACSAHGLKQFRSRPYMPRSDGKA